MAFTIKVRGHVSRIPAEYRCPVHGVFEVMVERDANGDSPGHAECPAGNPACGEPAPWTISAPGVHTQFVVSATQGKSEPPPHRMSMQTRALAEGQKHRDWKAERRALWTERRHQQLKKAFG